MNETPISMPDQDDGPSDLVFHVHSSFQRQNRITTACLLAAGTGSRLHPFTNSVPKCLTEVNGQPILKLLIDNLLANGFKRLVIVVGHLENCIRNYLINNAGGLNIEIITNPLYQTTNNIYSLWLARETIQESSLLIESDLIFDHSLMDAMLYPDKIAISTVQPWMSGTFVSMNSHNRVSAFNMGVDVPNASINENMFKTVNIYGLSWLSWQKVFKRLEVYISNGHVNEYYETVFKEMVANNNLSLEGVYFDPRRWYEIDTIEDLKNAEQILDQIRAFNGSQ